MVQKSWVGETRITHIRTNCYNIKIAFPYLPHQKPWWRNAFSAWATLICIFSLWQNVTDCRLANIARYYSDQVRGRKTLKKWSKSNFDQRARQWLNNLWRLFFNYYSSQGILKGSPRSLKRWQHHQNMGLHSQMDLLEREILTWIYKLWAVCLKKKKNHGTSLVVQRSRIHLAMQALQFDSRLRN